MPDFPEIKEQQIELWLGEKIARQGKHCFEQGLVVELESWEDEQKLDADVNDGGERPYQVHLHFLSDDELESRCSCPEGEGGCRHVAAALYAWMEEQEAESEPAGQFAFGMWLGALDKVKEGKLPTQDYPSNVSQRLLYILHPEEDHEVSLSFLSARLLRSGGYGRATPYDAANVLSHNVPQYVLSADERILREVATDRSFGSLRGYRLKGREGLNILKRALATDRCHWQSKDAPALKRADKRPGQWRWKLNARGDQHLTIEMEHGEVIVPTLPPWFIDVEKGVCGAIESGQPADVAEILLNMPAVQLDSDDAILAKIDSQLPADIPPPLRLSHEHRRVRPQPVLRLATMKLANRWGYRVPEELHYADLLFDYDGKRVAYAAEIPVVRLIKGDKAIDYERDREAEREAIEALAATGLIPLVEDDLGRHYDFAECAFSLGEAGGWPEWMLHEAPELKRQGFRLELTDSFPFKLEKARAWNLNMAGWAGEDGMSAQARFTVTLDNDEKIDLIAALARWVGNQPELLKEENLLQLKERQSIPLPLPDGRLLAAPGEMIASILHYMLDLFAAGATDAATLSAPQMLALEDALTGLDTPVHISTNAWLESMRQLADVGQVPVAAVPRGLKAQLRDYQRDGLNWMQFLRQMRLGGILADDMGLGKTVQALAHILKEKEEGRLNEPTLVIAPTSLVHNWRREAAKFTPDLSVLVIHGAERSQHFDVMADYDLVLTTYPLLVRDFEVLKERHWYMLILDEAQYIKNRSSKVSQQVRRLNASHKLCMTGTPMENHLGELWAQFDFLMPGYLFEQKKFTRLFRKPIELEGDNARQQALNLRIRPFLLRRSKEDVALELPPKTEIVRSIEIEGGQRELYESVRLAMQKKVRDAMASMGAGQSQIIMLDALMKMRQVCCDPRLVSGLQGSVPGSAKLEMLTEMVEEMVDEGRRILLFSQFTSMLELIEEELKKLRIGYVKLTGQTKERQKVVDRFQNGEVPLFLISLKAGGVGLNLTAADTVIHYDPWWNPAAEAQATDRAHRIGQEKAVFVYKLITEGTVEERILEMQERKRALAEGIHQQEGDQLSLWSPDDIESLFTPLS